MVHCFHSDAPVMHWFHSELTYNLQSWFMSGKEPEKELLFPSVNIYHFLVSIQLQDAFSRVDPQHCLMLLLNTEGGSHRWVIWTTPEVLYLNTQGCFNTNTTKRVNTEWTYINTGQMLKWTRMVLNKHFQICCEGEVSTGASKLGPRDWNSNLKAIRLLNSHH